MITVIFAINFVLFLICYVGMKQRDDEIAKWKWKYKLKKEQINILEIQLDDARASVSNLLKIPPDKRGKQNDNDRVDPQTEEA